MDRRLAQLVPSVATATLALMTAAWAATGEGPLGAAHRSEPLAVAAAATGPLVANDHDGAAILSAPAMAPGSTATGEVTVSNAGDAAGAFSLAASAPADAGGPAGGLSAILDLRVSDVTAGATPATLYTGTLAAFRGLDLGTLDAGAARRYRFEVGYPSGRSAAMDDPYQGASTSLGLSWTATAADSAPAPPPAPAPAPAPAPTPAPAPSAPSAPSPSAPSPSAPAPAASAPAAPAPATATAPAPGPPAASAPTVTLGAPAKAISGRRLVTWLQSTTTATARVTGTVSFSGRSAKLPATTVKLTAGRRRTVRVKLPAAAVAPKRRLTVRLAVTATAGGKSATVRRTLRVTAS
jgi:pyruvate dehydrogenase E2 component (dihydrolipoamide acetyltransferase)